MGLDDPLGLPGPRGVVDIHLGDDPSVARFVLTIWTALVVYGPWFQNLWFVMADRMHALCITTASGASRSAVCTPRAYLWGE